MLNIIASRTVRIVLIGNNLALWLFSAAARSDTDTGSPPFTLVANFNGTAPLEGILNQPRPTFAVTIIIVMSPTHIILQALSVLNILFLFVMHENTCQPSLLPGSRWWTATFLPLSSNTETGTTDCLHMHLAELPWPPARLYCNRIQTRSFYPVTHWVVHFNRFAPVIVSKVS